MERESSGFCIGEQPELVDCTNQDLLFLLRAEIQKGFDQLSAKLVGEIQDARLDFSRTSSPLPPVDTISPMVCNIAEKSTAEPPEFLPEKVQTQPATGKADFDNIGLDVSAGDNGVEDNNASQLVQQNWLNTASKTVESISHDWKANMSDVILSHMKFASTFKSLVADIQQEKLDAELASQRCLYRFVHNGPFTNLCLFIILANAFWMGYEADHRVASESGWRHLVGKIFNIWFIFELTLKIVALRWDFLCGSGYEWNLVDSLCVMSSIPDFFSTSMNLSFLRMIRLAKLTRGLRLVRLLKFLRSLREILMTVFYTMGSLFWSFVAIVFIAYIFSLLVLQVLGMHLDAGEEFSPDTMDNFKDVMSTMKALFSMISGGQDWYPFAQDFQTQGAHLAEVVLFFWIFFMLFGLLNVVIAVFCAQAEEVSQSRCDLRIEKDKEKQSKNMAEWIQIFKMIDSENRGYLNWGPFHEFAHTPNGQHLLSSHGLSHFALLDLWSVMSGYTGTDGVVDMTGFVMGFMRLSDEFQSSNLMLLSRELETLHKDARELLHELKKDMKFISRAVRFVAEKQGEPESPLNVSL